MVRRISRRSWSDLYQWAIILAGTLALTLVRPEFASDPWVLVTLTVLFALAEYLPTRVRVGAITFSFPIAYAAFLIYGVPGAAWVAALGTIIANLARNRSWRVTWFNGTQFALAALGAGQLSLWWPGAPTGESYLLPLLVYLALWYAINNLIVDGVLLIRLQQYRLEDWLTKNRYEALSGTVALAYSILMMVLAPEARGHSPLVLITFFLPLLTVGGFVRLLTHLSRFADHMSTLVEVSTLVTTNEGQALDTALAYLDRFDDYRYAAIYQLEGEELTLRALRGLPPEALSCARIGMGEGLTGWAAHQATSVLVGDIRHDARNTIGEGVREQATALAAIPLVSSGEVIGVLTVGKERGYSIQPEDLRLLTIFANLVATVLRNIGLAEERERMLVIAERNRLAREIHDGLAQSLAGTLLQMERVDRLVEGDARGARKLLGMLQESLREILLEVRRSIYNLRPSPLEVHGLVETLRREVQRLRVKDPAGSPQIRLEVRGEQRPLSGLVEDEVFRIAQEAVTNAIKHAGASEISVALQFSGDRLRLTVRDDGRGFHLADAVRRARAEGRFGLTGMSERAERLGAGFDVEARPGGGTRITVDVPLMGE